MTDFERKVVSGIEARWKEAHDSIKDQQTMSHEQAHKSAVFEAIDDLHWALDVREQSPFKEWKRLEADVEGAFKHVRQAFTEQRKFAERELSPAKDR